MISLASLCRVSIKLEEETFSLFVFITNSFVEVTRLCPCFFSVDPPMQVFISFLFFLKIFTLQVLPVLCLLVLLVNLGKVYFLLAEDEEKRFSI